MNVFSTDVSVRLDIYSRRGDSFLFDIDVNNADNTPFDFTDKTVTFQVFTSPGDRVANMSLTDGSGLTVSSGSISVSRTIAQMNALRNRTYLYFLKVANADGSSQTWLNGYFYINDGVNAPVNGSAALTIAPTGSNLSLSITLGGGSESSNPESGTNSFWIDVVISDSGSITLPLNTGKSLFKYRLWNPTGEHYNESFEIFLDIDLGSESEAIPDEFFIMVPIVIGENGPVTITINNYGGELLFIPSNFELRANENLITFTDSGTYVLHFVRHQADSIYEGTLDPESEEYAQAFPVKFNYEIISGPNGKVPSLASILNSPLSATSAVLQDLSIGLANKLLEIWGMSQLNMRVGSDPNGGNFLINPDGIYLTVVKDSVISQILLNDNGNIPQMVIRLAGDERLTFINQTGRKRMLLGEIPVVTDGNLTPLSQTEVYADQNGFLKLKP